MIYISPSNEYPRHPGDIQLQHPGWNPGDALPQGWVEVAFAPKPVAGKDELVYESFPLEVNGTMTQNWMVRGLTSEEIERRDAPETARQKLAALGLTADEISALLG